LTGDGRPDLIVANYGSNTVSVLLNTTVPGATTLSFADQQTFAVGNHPYVVVASDVNGDGRPDLIVANCVSATASVLLNTTAPGSTTFSFAAQGTFSASATSLMNPSRRDLPCSSWLARRFRFAIAGLSSSILNPASS